MVTHFENYGPYIELARNKHQMVNVTAINKENYMSHFNGILNIMRDGIEDPVVQSSKIHIILADREELDLTLTDYFFNLIFWTFTIYLDEPVTTTALFDTTAITKGSIKEYFDTIIEKHSEFVNFMYLNNLVDETLYKFKYINEFSMYLSNTVNFRDTLDLMNEYPEFNDTMHFDASNIPISDVKSAGMEVTRKQIKYITSHDHCLRDSFTSKEAISPKQFKEVSVNIGTKPDGRGGVFPVIINKSYMNGGVADPLSYVIDSSNARTAQILSKLNTGESGAFARILEANNLDTFFYPNPNYSCDTRNYIKVLIKDESWLDNYNRRYYKFNPDGPEYVLNKKKDIHLIGKELYFRSPMTCASFARGHGICRKCYGNMYYVNRDINPGKIATDELTSRYTQMLLSAKHLLESSVIEMKWPDEFFDIFELNLNMISVQEDLPYDTSRMYVVINSDIIESDDEDDDEDNPNLQYEEYITEFDLVLSEERKVTIKTEDDDNIYLTADLNRLIDSKKVKKVDNLYIIPLNELAEIPVAFTVKIQNKELQRTLTHSKHIINKDSITSQFSKDEIIKEFIMTNSEGGINVKAIHLETLLAAQIRNPYDILHMPNWAIPNVEYKILTLNSALTNNPSPTVSLEFQKIARTLVNPLTSKKRKASVMDMFFMEKPQEFAVNRSMISDAYKITEDTEVKVLKDAMSYIEKPEKEEESGLEEK